MTAYEVSSGSPGRVVAIPHGSFARRRSAELLGAGPQVFMRPAIVCQSAIVGKPIDSNALPFRPLEAYRIERPVAAWRSGYARCRAALGAFRVLSESLSQPQRRLGPAGPR